ncbi:S1 family peptidase [Phytomonospora endophytica]|uniref:Tetratricopeptide (TPR) repeat protein n=1 Tax=Phytomonospora endophytica TaxID=714109 RepID=A0A841FTW0_9ACTN|nr:serine protease [Phytomonospora endophytica]MBB6039775.1 tetratricopeptide (TPR) repeat protein [Phytomonospora endophytica]GIG70888.1 hypothetical protein Pen01_71830 [Phytomonospora endophytica]
MEAARVVEVLRDDAERRAGSGYLVCPGKVLTAWHVVQGASALRIRLAGSLSAATVAFFDAASDLAVLDAVGTPVVSPVRLTSLDGDFVAASVAGYPWWKRRPDGSYSLAHEQGSIAVLANDREGTLQLTVAPPEAHPDPDSSPWQGISGGPVFVGGSLVGVLARHHAREGLNRLTAARVDGCPPLTALLGYVPRPAQNPHLREFTPVGGLLDRGAELDAMAAFCSGEESYFWWQAGPWAGKSALMAAFSLNPPPHVEVVPYFIRAAVAADATGDAFTQFLLTRLAGLNGEGTPVGERDHHRSRLLQEVAERLASQGRRLVLLVDGLDEDLSGEGAPGIASLLPRHPPPDMQVIVASRPSPDLPDDVAHDHPLRTCAPRTLRPSPHAADLARLARAELRSVLGDMGWKRDVVGFLAAGGGGMTVEDLEELTEIPRDLIADMLGGVVGRTLNRAEDDTYAFAHETLLNEARARLGDRQLRAYRERVVAWAETYSNERWPEETPGFVFGPYFAMLQEDEETAILARLAHDSARHDHMLRLTGGDAWALTEIRTAQRMLAGAEPPDLYTLALLTAHRDRVADRNAHIPSQLPAVWALLGEHDRTTALLGGITEAAEHLNATAELAVAYAITGDTARLTALTPKARERIGGSRLMVQARVLARLVEAAATGGQRVLTNGLLRALAGLVERYPDARRHLIAALGGATRFPEAIELATRLDPAPRLKALLDLAECAIAKGNLVQAEQLYRAALRVALGLNLEPWAAARLLALRVMLAFPDERPAFPLDAKDPEALCHLAFAALHVGDRVCFTEFLERLLTQVEASKETPLIHRGIDLAVSSGDHTAAARFLAASPNDIERAQSFAVLAGCYARSGDHERAREAALASERLARASVRVVDFPTLLIIASALLPDNDFTAAGSTRLGAAPNTLIEAWIDAGRVESAVRLARLVDSESPAPIGLCTIIAAPSIDPQLRRALISEVLEGAAGHENEAIGKPNPTRTVLDHAIGAVVAALCSAGLHTEAANHARTVREPGARNEALWMVVAHLLEQGEDDLAMKLAEGISTTPNLPTPQVRPERLRPFTVLSEYPDGPSPSERAFDHAVAGRIEQATELAEHARAFTEQDAIFLAIAEAGEPELAVRLARRKCSPNRLCQLLLKLIKLGRLPAAVARRFMAEALPLGRFEDFVLPLAMIDPEACQRIIIVLYPHLVKRNGEGHGDSRRHRPTKLQP